MTLKKVLIYSSIVLLSACAPAIIYKTAWQDTPVVADGQTNDWQVPLRFFDEKSKLSYSISNDDSMLFICVRATDADNIRGITHSGLQIWIDTTGKKGKQVGILYPYIQARVEGEGKHKGGAEGQTVNAKSSGDDDVSSNPSSFMNMPDTMKENMMHRHYVQNAKQMRVSGFTAIPTGIVELPDVYGICMGTNWDSYNIVVVEAAIPFRTFLKKAHADASKVLGVTLSYTVKLKHMQTYGSRGMGGGRGMGGMGGGGYGGGGSGAEQVHAPVEETDVQSVWAPFTLSLGKQH